MKRFLRAAVTAAFFAVTAVTAVAIAPPAVVAIAQTTVSTPAGPALTTPAGTSTNVTTSGPETTVNVGQLLAPWLQGLVAAVISVIMAMFGWLTVVINKRAGLESNAAVLQMEAHARELLETALTNAAGSIVMKAGPKLDGMVIDVKNPLIAQGILQVNTWAQAAVVRFGLTPDDLAKKLIDKIGVITAANPAVTPTTPAA
ncbi:MAG: hypothetical protein JWR80_9988 [Bradyrhizobium sp.]|nr:hypothetical protein [Bradyrhizobium sp.]